MSDEATVRELIVALSENGRAAHSLSTAAHRGFVLLERNTEKLDALEAQVAQLRASVETLLHVEADRNQLRREELNLQRDKLELEQARVHAEITGEVARAEKEAAPRLAAVETVREAGRGVAAFAQTRGGLVLCGMVLVIAAQGVMGTGPLLDLLSGIAAVLKGFGFHP